jgi:cobalamin biosynthesis Mg chelatase CobN
MVPKKAFTRTKVDLVGVEELQQLGRAVRKRRRGDVRVHESANLRDQMNQLNELNQ